VGKINWSRVILCGLLAGIVLNVFDGAVYGKLLAADVEAMMRALGKPPLAKSAMVWFITCDFLLGIVLLWFYAAIRPRFGAGPRTAVIAGVAMWVVIGTLSLSQAPMDLYPSRFYSIGLPVALVQYVLAALAGAGFYQEA
jgi:hypothetical protein